MKPVLGYYPFQQLEEFVKKGGVVRAIIAEELNIQPQDIIDYELCLYPLEPASIVGANGEYFQSGRIDDLSMAFAGLEALLAESEHDADATRVLAIFDNEETGSGTKQGAASPVLRDIAESLCRIAGCLPYDGQVVHDFCRRRPCVAPQL